MSGDMHGGMGYVACGVCCIKQKLREKMTAYAIRVKGSKQKYVA
jgi:hypothetical protein